ncbi:membrane protein FxsA [Caldibacillus lycopersici]|uniref:Membrane protein FxsA n=1 Tax=Perspicuibacillus lycopersici TaxID=1325689 RepID=A0AAE3LTL4_9BACI|nr:FxsA family protein [Perspicuibacillus lycopersici]MCU9614188.1 membrane protein FxsA [Perspicuibacillus lycopersici]
MRYLIPVLIILPALEIGLLLYSGHHLGIGTTILLIIFTGVVGAYLAKKQGLETIRSVQQQLQYGIPPGEAILDGLCILVGGVLLLAPGFITDCIGFLLLLPFTRKIVKPLIKKWFKHLIDHRTITIIR